MIMLLELINDVCTRVYTYSSSGADCVGFIDVGNMEFHGELPHVVDVDDRRGGGGARGGACGTVHVHLLVELHVLLLQPVNLLPNLARNKVGKNGREWGREKKSGWVREGETIYLFDVRLSALVGFL